MGGKSSTLSWLTVPLRWTPVSASVIMDTRYMTSADVFAREPSSSSMNALNKELVGGDIFAARCMGLLFGHHAIKLPEPDSAGGYNSALSQLLQASVDEFDDVVKNIIDCDVSQPPPRPAAAAAAAADETAGSEEPKKAQFECLQGELTIPLRNYRILVLHIVRLLEQFCAINTANESVAAASLLMSGPVCFLLFPPISCCLIWIFFFFFLFMLCSGKERTVVWNEASYSLCIILFGGVPEDSNGVS